MTKRARRQYDNDVSKRMADFVRGRTNVPREMFQAAFPHTSGGVVALLHELGFVGPGRPRGHRFTDEQRAKAQATLRAKRVAKRVAKLRAQLSALEAES